MESIIMKMNQFGRAVVTSVLNTDVSAHWQLPLLQSFVRLDGDTRENASAVFRLSNQTESRLPLQDMFALRGYAAFRSQQFPAALGALNMAFRRAADAGLMSIEVNFPGQIPTLDF
jgi:hypothetical protein